MREIVLDIETTGLSPTKGHRIVEIGCVELVDRQITGNTYQQYINPERESDPRALKTHGLSMEFLSEYPTFTLVADSFLDFIADSKLVIHNARFDMSFINHELVLAGRDRVHVRRIVDTLSIAREKHGSPANLNAVCARYKVDTTVRSSTHGALIDANVLAIVYPMLIGKYK